MLKVSTKGRYVLRFMIQLAGKCNAGPVLIKDIAEKEAISANYLVQLISPLKSAGLIFSSRGSHGGYILAKPPDQISVKEIIESIEGPFSLVECVIAPGICTRASECLSRDVWVKATKELSRVFQSMKLSDLLK
jgi:Rrf2 family transcriptional regulator, cysteine metabolism repressor